MLAIFNKDDYYEPRSAATYSGQLFVQWRLGPPTWIFRWILVPKTSDVECSPGASQSDAWMGLSYVNGDFCLSTLRPCFVHHEFQKKLHQCTDGRDTESPHKQYSSHQPSAVVFWRWNVPLETAKSWSVEAHINVLHMKATYLATLQQIVDIEA